jgi:teichuronic acid biosynthesis glycosyltransferase TuaG
MITVLMAAKTSTQYMPQAIGSLLGQSYQGWELIIGVNGLPPLGKVFDEACRLTEPWRDRMFVWDLPQCTNKAEALNEMVVQGRNDPVAILDVDDLWHPIKLERQLPILQAGYDVCGTAGMYFGNDNNDIGVPRGGFDRNLLKRQNCILNSSVVMRRDLAHWEPMNEPLEDYELWLRLASQGRTMFNQGDYLTFIRQHAGNWSKQSNHETALARLRARYA